MGPALSPHLVRLGLSAWPPFLFSGTRVAHIAPDWSEVVVVHRVGRFNRNFNGSAFGGAIFAMVDPFFPLIALKQLGPGYRVWSKDASIEFLAPGRGELRSQITLGVAEIDVIREYVDADGKSQTNHEADVHAEDGKLIAHVRQRIHVSRRT